MSLRDKFFIARDYLQRVVPRMSLRYMHAMRRHTSWRDVCMRMWCLLQVDFAVWFVENEDEAASEVFKYLARYLPPEIIVKILKMAGNDMGQRYEDWLAVLDVLGDIFSAAARSTRYANRLNMGYGPPTRNVSKFYDLVL